MLNQPDIGFHFGIIKYSLMPNSGKSSTSIYIYVSECALEPLLTLVYIL